MTSITITQVVVPEISVVTVSGSSISQISILAITQPTYTISTNNVAYELGYTRVLGSAYSGSTGDTGRSYTHSIILKAKALIAVGGAGGALTPLDPDGGYSLSTTVIANDTLTITQRLFDDEVVIIWQ